MSSLSSTAPRAVLPVLAAVLLLAGGPRASAAPILEVALPTAAAEPLTIVRGPDGACWFVEEQVGQVGRVTTNGVVTEYSLNAGSCFPIGIAVGPDSNLWCTEFGTARVARLAPNATNIALAQFLLPSGVYPNDITLGPDGRLWILDFGNPYYTGGPANGGVLALKVTTNGITTSYYNSGLTANCRPAKITSAPDGNLYFTEQLAGKIARITTNGVITESPYLSANCQPFDITTGPDGALWFTEANVNRLGRIDTGFTRYTEYSLPSNPSGLTADQPGGLIVGPDGNFWYTDPPAGCITRVIFPGTNSTVNATQFFTPATNSYPERLAIGADGNLWFGEYLYNYPQWYQNNIGEFVFPAPLHIQFASSNLVVSWAASTTTFYSLQTNSDLTTANWGFATNVPIGTNNLFEVTIPATNFAASNLFFRLSN